MRRNYRSEIVVAVAAILLIGGAVLFAVVLTSTSTEANATETAVAQQPTQTPTFITLTPDPNEVATQQAQQVIFETIALQASETAAVVLSQVPPKATISTATTVPTVLTVVATVETAVSATMTATTDSMVDSTPSVVPTLTSTAVATTRVPQRTEVSTPTATKVVPSVTPKAQATQTPTAIAPSPTDKPSQTPRVVVNTPTETPILVATNTPTKRPSNTPIPVTKTATPTAIPPTNTPTATQTRIPATATPTPTASFTATNTATKRPTLTPTTVPPTKTPSPVPTISSDIVLVPPAQASATRTPTNCVAPNGWTTYTVQPNNTLFAIALAVNSTVDELKDVNCLTDADSIKSGQVIFVPIAPNQPVGVVPNVALPAGQVIANRGCINPEATLTSPIALQHVNGTFTVYGTATRANFWYYKLEVRPDNSTTYNFYSDSYTPVVNNVLGQINSTLFGKGLYWLRLSVVDLTGGIQADAFCEVPLLFD